jgi:hypothetical protein
MQDLRESSNPAALLRRPCPACQCEIAMHQPDPTLPERLLVTCAMCKAWFLIDGMGHWHCAVPAVDLEAHLVQ